MTIPNNTTAKLIGLAACGAAALGLSLDAALLTRTEDLLAALTAAGLLPTATRQPAAESSAVLTAPAALPVAAAQAEKWKPAPPSLTRPGDILEAPEDIDWDDPALYV